MRAHNHTIIRQVSSIPAYVLTVTVFINNDLLQQCRGDRYQDLADLFYKAQCSCKASIGCVYTDG